jgi:hypothetical protein
MHVDLSVEFNRSHFPQTIPAGKAIATVASSEIAPSALQIDYC